MKKTALYEKHLALDAKMIEYAGYSMPVSYRGIREEHEAVRQEMGIFDVSHMGEFLVLGKDALRYVNYLVTNTIQEDYKKVTYTLLCDQNGFVVDDALIYPMSEEKILLVVNAGNMEKDWMWVNENSEGFDIQLKNVTEDFSQIAIQGPKVINHIEKILGFDVKSMSFMTFGVLPYQDGHIIVSRTGYTGEDGFEIYGHHHLVENLWDNAINEKAVPCGLGARDTLRFEANLPLYGHEISESINPIEAGLGFAVKLDKHFIGRDALLHAKENLSRKTVGIELLEKGIPRHGYDIFAEDKKVGFITTGYMLPTQEKPIAVAMVEIDYAELGTQLYVVIRQNKVLARVRNKKFYTKNYKK